MPIPPTTLERAYELARSGECSSISEIIKRLVEDGYPNVRARLDGPAIKKDLRRLCQAAEVAKAPPKAARGR
jgi:hypothetical protein